MQNINIKNKTGEIILNDKAKLRIDKNHNNKINAIIIDDAASFETINKNGIYFELINNGVFCGTDIPIKIIEEIIIHHGGIHKYELK